MDIDEFIQGGGSSSPAPKGTREAKPIAFAQIAAGAPGRAYGAASAVAEGAVASVNFMSARDERLAPFVREWACGEPGQGVGPATRLGRGHPGEQGR